MRLIGRLALLVVKDIRIQRLAEAHAVPVLRDVDAEVVFDFFPHNLRPLPRLCDIGNTTDVLWNAARPRIVPPVARSVTAAMNFAHVDFRSSGGPALTCNAGA